jgi:hypothetical protein
MIPALAETSAKTEAICEHLAVSFSEASEETDGVAPGCVSVDRVFSSPKRAACVLSGDADIPETAWGKWIMPQSTERWRRWARFDAAGTKVFVNSCGNCGDEHDKVGEPGRLRQLYYGVAVASLGGKFQTNTDFHK